MGMFKRAFSGLALCLLLFISGPKGAARSPGLRWSLISCKISSTFTYNGVSCSWSVDGNDVSGVELTVSCDDGAQGLVQDGDTLWDAQGCAPYIKTVTMTNIKQFNAGMFNGKEMLQTLDLSGCAELATVEASLCEGCGKLATLKLPATVTSIGARAFFGCSLLKTIPSTVTDVGESAFEGTGITSLDFGQLTVAKRAFAGCKQLTTAILPASISFPESIFEECSSLTQVTVKDGAGAFHDVGDRAFFGCSALTALPPITGTHIGDSAFQGCSKLSITLEVPATLAVVGSSAFEGSGVVTVDASRAPNLIAHSRVFADCKALTKVVLPQMSEVPALIFDGCSELTTLQNFPTELTSIGLRAFAGCAKLALTFTASASLNSIADSAFAGSGITSFDASKISAATLASFTLGTNVFASCKDLTKVTFSSQMVNLPEGTFDGCTKLRELASLPSFVTIGKRAFFDCSSLAVKLVAPPSLTSVGESAFEGAGVTSIDTSNTKCTFGARGVARCQKLTEFVLPSEIQTLPDYLFTESGLTSIEIPESVTAIGAGCFENCKSLTNVTYFGKSEIASDIFQGCENLETVSVPDDYPYGSFGGYNLGGSGGGSGGSGGSPGLSGGAKAGIAIGVIAVVVIVVVVVVIVFMRRRKAARDDNVSA